LICRDPNFFWFGREYGWEPLQREKMKRYIKRSFAKAFSGGLFLDRGEIYCKVEGIDRKIIAFF
jgi:hypothetical protein